MKWYEEHYVNRREWILEHLDLLGLSPSEAITVMFIDYMNQYQLPITVDALQKRTNLNEDQMNEVITSLITKKFLEIRAVAGQPKFILDGLFEYDIHQTQNILDGSLYELFEEEFGRPLNQREMEKIAVWHRDTDRNMILLALRRASALDKKTIPYIDKIISNWKKTGVSIEKIEEGKA